MEQAKPVRSRFTWLRVEIMDDRGEFFRGETFAGSTAYTSARYLLAHLKQAAHESDGGAIRESNLGTINAVLHRIRIVAGDGTLIDDEPV